MQYRMLGSIGAARRGGHRLRGRDPGHGPGPAAGRLRARRGAIPTCKASGRTRLPRTPMERPDQIRQP